MKKAFAALLALALACSSLNAQTKKETKQYNDAVKKNTVKLYEKFLKKYPESVYAHEIAQKRDLILVEQNRDYHYELIRTSEGWLMSIQGMLDGESVEIRSVGMDCPEGAGLLSSLSSVQLGDKPYMHFSYMAREGTKAEYTGVLFDCAQEAFSSASFYGRLADNGTIEGSSPDAISLTTGASPEIVWLLRSFDENPALIKIAREVELSDQAVEWWYDKNPDAMKSSKTLSFGKLFTESSLVEGYAKAEKERAGAWSAAIVRHRGDICIVACNKSTGEYTLVWCEPETKGRRIANFYIETGASNLNLVVYQGRSMIKYKINLNNKKISRA